MDKTKKKRKRGQPTKYRRTMPAKLRAYIENCPDALPSRPGFAVVAKVCEKTIDKWGEKWPLFAEALEELRSAQHMTLINKGLTGAYNSTIAKLILSSNHGYKERQDTTTGNEPLKQSQINISVPESAKESDGPIEPQVD